MDALKRGLRAVFLRIEAALEAVFGARHNPLTQLGTLGWFLFWIVAVSGIYLFIFFDTGIERAFHEFIVAGAVPDEAGALLDRLDGDLLAIHAHAVAGAEYGAHEGRGFERVLAHGAGGGEDELDAAARNAEHGAEAELRLGGRKPALTGNQSHQRHTPIGLAARITAPTRQP